MRKPEQSPEPSIEEILASIRRIIADDSGPAAPSTQASMPEQLASVRQRRLTSAAAEADDWTSELEQHYAEPAEPAELGGDEEILELTEDFMVEERAARKQAELTSEPSQPPARPAGDFSSLESDLIAVGLADRRHGLESVLSNVAAEVERLSAVKPLSTETKAAPVADWPDGTVAAPPMAAPPSFAQSAKSAPAPQPPAAPEKPVTRAPSPAAAPKPAASRPVWSARHLENEGGGRQQPRSTPARPSGQSEPTARPKGLAERDSWAEGIQMPVPESGPAAPPFARDLEEEADATPPLSGSGEALAHIEEEKNFVGEMLTRVFASAPKRDEPAAAFEAEEPKSKVEKLAKSAVSDFASEMLRAPVVAEALHADKPFMEAISDTLETALSASPSPEKVLAGVARGAAAAATHEEFPEAMLPPDAEEPEAFAAPPAAPAPSFRPAPQPAGRNEPREAAAAKPSVQPIVSETTFPKAELPAGLEDAIKEMIKPLIVQWLNDNLPRIVEKAVREEIAEQSLVSPQRGVRR